MAMFLFLRAFIDVCPVTSSVKIYLNVFPSLESPCMRKLTVLFVPLFCFIYNLAITICLLVFLMWNYKY